MTQRHFEQQGIFHVTTNTRRNIPWCVWPGVPEILIDNLCMTRNIYQAEVYAFCILPNHMHVVLRPGLRGLSAFMHSFKRNSAFHISAVMHFTAAEIHESPLRKQFTGWQKGFHDERIESAQQLEHALRYVRYNAWRHHFTNDPEDWPWSSLRFAHLMDPTDIW